MQQYPSARSPLSRAQRRKKLRSAFALALFLGPLGLFYTDPFGGFVMFSATLIMFLLLPPAGMILVWLACIAWALVYVNRTSKLMMKKNRYYLGKF